MRKVFQHGANIMLICEHIACTHCNATNDQDAQIESRGSNNYTPLPHLPHLASGTDTQSITTHATFAIAVLPLRVTKSPHTLSKNTIPQQLIAGRQHYTQTLRTIQANTPILNPRHRQDPHRRSCTYPQSLNTFLRPPIPAASISNIQ